MGWVEKGERQSSALQSVVCCKLRLLPFVPVGWQRQQARALARLVTSDSPWPTFVSRVWLLLSRGAWSTDGAAQRWTRTRATLLPWAVVSWKHSGECCRAEGARVGVCKGQRACSSPSAAAQARAKLISFQKLLCHSQAERSLLSWTANF